VDSVHGPRHRPDHRGCEAGISPESAGQLRGAPEPTGPQVNRDRIEKFKKLLEENLALASFGL
jgi:hypothetical protein